jgi:hypothetical protein
LKSFFDGIFEIPAQLVKIFILAAAERGFASVLSEKN